ncbi:hypothetical protein PAXRUDRAFT_299725 [Paxillus rubicundulus Ve08.2h10]|uniref:Unplaced genomic scaffold scaffold_159, whole genome shotgun sequence n=1 Tax=Paxillus rubicundulus Ve08.2h10 TaxID=930991 RepID=A0A0D0E046_9AGAM|nr:hypothetical protein PAXRUDRAFT_299725 [Paxillus rubicundulus Ve08.2h10]
MHKILMAPPLCIMTFSTVMHWDWRVPRLCIMSISTVLSFLLDIISLFPCAGTRRTLCAFPSRFQVLDVLTSTTQTCSQARFLITVERPISDVMRCPFRYVSTAAIATMFS